MAKNKLTKETRKVLQEVLINIALRATEDDLADAYRSALECGLVGIYRLDDDELLTEAIGELRGLYD